MDPMDEVRVDSELLIRESSLDTKYHMITWRCEIEIEQAHSLSLVGQCQRQCRGDDAPANTALAAGYTDDA